MKLVGDEKRIQALFSELSLADRKHTPDFEELWRAGEVTGTVSRSRRPIIVIAAILFIALTGSVATWMRYASVQTPPERNAQELTPQAISTPAAPPDLEPEKVPDVNRRAQSHPKRQKSFVRQKRTEAALEQSAAMLASWQSPTGKFLESPTGPAFNSLPQLNQSIKDLESFLPKNNESTKESNK